MAFEAEQPKAADSVGDIAVIITDYSDSEIAGSATYEVQILQADGSMFRLATGDLSPHLSAAQINGLKALMADIRTKAQKLIQTE